MNMGIDSSAGIDKFDGPRAFMPLFSKVCSRCAHYNPYLPGHVCSAFPDGIPDVIWLGENEHREVYPGDNGIQFEPMRKAQDE